MEMDFSVFSENSLDSNPGHLVKDHSMNKLFV